MFQCSYNSFFVNLANKTNLEIISILKQGPLNVNSISEKTGIEQSAVSHNLRKMALCKILNVEQKGRERIYSLNEKTIVPILKLVDTHVVCNCTECNYKVN